MTSIHYINNFSQFGGSTAEKETKETIAVAVAVAAAPVVEDPKEALIKLASTYKSTDDLNLFHSLYEASKDSSNEYQNAAVGQSQDAAFTFLDTIINNNGLEDLKKMNNIDLFHSLYKASKDEFK